MSTAPPPVPTRIHLSEDRTQLLVHWSDGLDCAYPLKMLRKKCPCAVCTADAKAKGPFYIPLFTTDAMTLKEINPQGNYAVQFVWMDGHHTGIYDYAYLRGLCPDADDAAHT
ncbi:MAG: DUF971 domain-containing protein [Bacteroidota bacterium]|nr:DUF971 domain-containing protein [Bacteroidota bacterium]